MGDGTYRRLPPGTRADPLPPLRVKGKQEAVVAYVLRELSE